MSKIIVTGDTQYREGSPFYESKELFNQWFIDQEFNNEDNYLVHLGDVVDKSMHTGLINRQIVEFFSKLKFKKIYIITGNHEVSRTDGNMLEVLKTIPSICLIEHMEEIEINGFNCLCLPHFYRKNKKDKTMTELYRSLDSKIEYDFIFGHFSDETQTMFGRYIDISHLKGKKLLGHIHIPTERYVGSPVINRYDEKGKENRLFIIDQNKDLESLEIPRFMEYKTISYGEPIKDELYYVMYDVIKAPSKEMVYENKLYKDKFIRKIHLEKSEEDISNDYNTNITDKSNKDYFEEFCSQNKINKLVKEKIIFV